MPRRMIRARRAPSARLTERDFDGLVQEALEALPAWVRERLQTVTIAVADEPPADEDPDLLGLYEGDSLLEETAFAAPPVVTIFQGPHERACRTRAELRREVTETVLHELAHHFGMDEGEIEALGPLRMPRPHRPHPSTARRWPL